MFLQRRCVLNKTDIMPDRAGDPHQCFGVDVFLARQIPADLGLGQARGTGDGALPARGDDQGCKL